MDNQPAKKSTPAIKRFVKRYPHWAICFVLIICVTFYWSFWASNRYVSHSDVVVSSPEISAPDFSLSSLLSSNAGSGNQTDMMMLRDYLLSVDMLKILEKEANFREEYSKQGDMFSRLLFEDTSLEKLYNYYQRRVSVEMDSTAGVLRIDVQAYTPEEAHKIGQLLITEGERQLNRLNQSLAEGQVNFLEKQVAQLKDEYSKAQQELITYQNDHGLASPSGALDTITGVVSSLQAQLATKQAQRSALLSYQSPTSPQVVALNGQIGALQSQIREEERKAARTQGGALNAVSSEYQALLLHANFAQQSFSGALSALQSTRIEAARQLKQVSMIQTPTFPEYPEEPMRIYNITVFAVIAIFITLIVNMLILIVRDHKD